MTQIFFKGSLLWILSKMSGVLWYKLQLFPFIQIKTKYTEVVIFVSITPKNLPTIKNKKVLFQPPLEGGREGMPHLASTSSAV